MNEPTSFYKQLRELLDSGSISNSISKESNSNIRDSILANYLTDCLIAFETAVIRRDACYDVQLSNSEENSELQEVK